MSNSETIAALGVLFSFFALIISIASYCTSKKSLSISKQQHDERSLGVSLSYVDAYKWKKDGETFVSFALNFTNHSSLPSTILKIELQIEYRYDDEIVRKVKISPDMLVAPINLKNYNEILDRPLKLQDKSAKLGWVSFKLPRITQEQLTIDLYQIIAKTIDNEDISIYTHIINEV